MRTQRVGGGPPFNKGNGFAKFTEALLAARFVAFELQGEILSTTSIPFLFDFLQSDFTLQALTGILDAATFEF